MKFRHQKIKREHSIIDGGLDWLKDLSKHKDVSDIIPGVIDVTNSKERGIVYKYETPTGCKLFMKSGGSIQEVFVVTKKPEAVEEWVSRIMEELSFFQAALVDAMPKDIYKEASKSVKPKTDKAAKTTKPLKDMEFEELQLSRRDGMLSAIKEEYQLVEINQGLRDSLVESLASMADLENPKIKDAIDPVIKEVLEKLYKAQSPNHKDVNKNIQNKRR